MKKKRYFRLHEDNTLLYQKYILESCRNIAEQSGVLENDYEAVLISSDGYIQTEPTRDFNTEKVNHDSKSSSDSCCFCFYLSPFNKALIVSYDGGGDDGHFNIYMGKTDGIKFLEKIPSDFGGGFLCGSLIREVQQKKVDINLLCQVN